MTTCFFSILLVLAFPSVQLPDVSPKAEQTSASIHGVVRRADTGETLARALIEVKPVAAANRPVKPDPKRVYSDSRGYFEIGGLGAGLYTITAYKNGYLRREFGRKTKQQSAAIELRPSQDLKLQFDLTPGSLVTGRIFNEFGEPLPHIIVQALRTQFGVDGRQMLEHVQSARTNDLGEYRLFWLEPGNYFLKASLSDGSMVVPGESNVAASDLIPTFYPSVIDELQAQRISVPAGTERHGIDIIGRTSGLIKIKGQILSGFPEVSGVSVSLIRRHSFASPWPATIRRTGAQNTFEIAGVPPGDYWLVATIPLGAESLSKSIPLSVGGIDIENLTVTVNRGISISGKIHLEELVGKQTTLGPSSNPADLAMQVSLVGESHFQTVAGLVGKDGRFVMKNVEPGLYEVFVAPLPPTAYIKGLRLNAQAAQDRRIEITPQDQNADFDILIGPAGQVSGEVITKEAGPQRGSLVVLIPADRLRDEIPLYKTAAVDENDRFDLGGIVPGEYKLFAWENLEPFGYFDRDLVQRFSDRGVPLKIQEGERLQVRVQVITEAERLKEP